MDLWVRTDGDVDVVRICMVANGSNEFRRIAVSIGMAAVFGTTLGFGRSIAPERNDAVDAFDPIAIDNFVDGLLVGSHTGEVASDVKRRAPREQVERGEGLLLATSTCAVRDADERWREGPNCWALASSAAVPASVAGGKNSNETRTS